MALFKGFATNEVDNFGKLKNEIVEKILHETNLMDNFTILILMVWLKVYGLMKKQVKDVSVEELKLSVNDIKEFYICNHKLNTRVGYCYVYSLPMRMQGP